jgi:FkbM family methyltransferase
MNSPSDPVRPSEQNLDLAALRAAFDAGAFNKAAYSREIWKFHRQLFEYSSFLQGTNVAAIEITEEGLVFKLRHPELRLWCTPNDQRHVAISSLNFRDYESDEVSAVLRLIKACSVIFDIGANVGFYSVAIGQRFPDSKIIAFEPVPATYSELQRNLALNRITNVTPLNLGLSDHSFDATFYFDPTVTGAASAAPLGSEFGATETLTCPVETLDAFVERTGLVPDFIKCDVEGGEFNVFRGATRMFERHKPMVFTEMLRKWAARFGYHPNDIIALFRTFGYECFVLREGTLHSFPAMTEETVETNFFFLHTQRHLEMVRFLGLLK